MWEDGAGSHAGAVTRARAALLLLGPCIVYLVAFSVFPLLYSLRNSFTDLGISKDSGQWVGLDNYVAIFNDPFFWNAAGNTAVMVGSAVVIQVVLGTALALFMNQQPARLVVRAWCAHPAHAADAHRGGRDVAGDAQPRLGHRQLARRGAGTATDQLAGLHGMVDAHPGHRRHVAVDAVRLPHRVCAPPGPARPRARGSPGGRRWALGHVPAHHPAACWRPPSRSRRSSGPSTRSGRSTWCSG